MSFPNDDRDLPRFLNSASCLFQQLELGLLVFNFIAKFLADRLVHFI